MPRSRKEGFEGKRTYVLRGGAMCGGRDPWSLVSQRTVTRKSGTCLSESTFFKSPMAEKHAKGCRDHDDDDEQDCSHSRNEKGDTV